MAEQKKLHVIVLGTPEHEGQMCGHAFDILGITPTYVDPGRPEIPRTPTPHVVLLSREWSVALRHAAVEARQAGLPVIYVMDGVIEWSYMWDGWSFVKPEGTVLQPLIASDLCVIGRHPARILAALGLGERIHVVGMPRVDGLNRQRILDQDQSPRIVVATAKTFGQNVAHKVFVRAALRDLKNWFDTHPDIVPVWRIAGHVASDLGLIPSCEGTLVESLQTASGLVSFASSALLEGMLLGVPTAQIDYRSVPQYVQVGWEIRSADHIDNVIRELLHPPPENLAFQEACLRDELEVGNASARLADVLRQAARGDGAWGTGPEQPEKPLRGQLDYRQVHSHLSSFSVSPMSRLQYELDATYTLRERDRQQLAALRRSIDEIRKLHGGLLTAILQRLTWLPGFRRTARLLKNITSLNL